MKNIKIAAFALLSLFATTKVMAETVTEDFESVTITNADTWGRGTELSNGWFIQGGYIANSPSSQDYGFWTTAYNSSSKSLTAQAGSSNSAYVIIPSLLSGDFSFYYRKTSDDSRSVGKVYAYKVTESNGTYTIGSRIFMDEEATKSWQQCTSIHLTEPTMIAIKIVRAAIDDVTYNTASLEPHEHSYATEWSSDEKEHWHACTSTVGICDTKKIDVAAHDGLTCSVCGYKTPGIEIYPWLEDFNSITSGIPAGWDNSEGTTTTDSYKWKYYSKSVRFDSYNNYENRTNVLATPLLYIPSTGAYELKFKVKNPKGGNYEVKIAEYGSAERTTLFDNLTNIADWTEKSVSLADYAGKAVKIYFCGTSNWGSGDAYLYLDDVSVKELPTVGVMEVSTTAEVTRDGNTLTDAFGVLRTKATHTYTISNTGGGTLEVALTSNNTTDFTLSTTSLSVAPGESATFDLTFNIRANNYGAKEAAITLTPNAGDVVTINASAESLDPSKFYEDFEGGIPSTWTNTGWTIANAPTYGNGTKMAYAGSGYYNKYTLTTPRLMAMPGDIMYIEALQMYNDDELTLEYSLDNGDTWETGFSIKPEANNTLHTLQFAAPQAGVYLIRFSGPYNYIDNVYGFRIATIPDMEISSAVASKEGKTFTDNLGITNSEASHTYTVKNTGSGSITLYFNSNNTAFTVSPSTLTIAEGKSADFKVVAKSETAGEMSGTITINSNCGLPVYTINANATFLDPAKFYVDFEDGIPADWTNGGWQSSKGATSDNETKMAYSHNSQGYLVTPLLQAKDGETIQFEYLQVWDDEPFSVEYTINDVDWNEVFTIEKGEGVIINKYDSYTWTAPTDGFYKLRFKGMYYYIDNVYGFAKPSTSQTLVATDGEKYYATFSSDKDIIFAPGVEVSTVSVVDKKIQLTPVENNYVPAGTGVLLSSTANKALYLEGSLSESQIAADNMLRAASVAMEQTGYKFYKLAYNDYANKTGLGFYYGATDGAPYTVKAGAYLAVPASLAGVKGYTFGTDTEDAINHIDAVSNADQTIYNLQGQRIQKMQKGIHIVGGRKVVVR